MMRKSSLSKIAALLVGTFLVGLNPIVAKADSYAVISMANDITDAEKTQVYQYFGLTKGQAQEIVITNADERNALLGMVPEAQIGNKTVSSAYVNPTSSGGIKVETQNLTWVTNSMLTNTLITLGITNADVKAYAPYAVSGTGALTGIMKAFEAGSDDSTEITEEQKEVANEELVMTGQLGDTIGKEEASAVVNEVKTQVIKDSPKTDIEIGNIITNVTNNYNVELSENDKAKMISVMSKINNLDLDYKDLKDTLKTNKQNLAMTLQALGSDIQEAEWYGKAWNSIKSFGRWIKDGFLSIIDYISNIGSNNENDVKEKDGIQYDEDGNIIIDGNLYIPEENRTPEEIKQKEATNNTEEPSVEDSTVETPAEDSEEENIIKEVPNESNTGDYEHTQEPSVNSELTPEN